MGLRLHPATETDIGAMLIFSYFASPVKVLTIPPCRYQVEAIGDLNVRSLPYNEIKSRMQALVTYPVVHEHAPPHLPIDIPHIPRRRHVRRSLRLFAIPCGLLCAFRGVHCISKSKSEYVRPNHFL
ncbi:hypothetical protein DYB35_013259 [Aphanomyces astaci]|uniref:Uncharacterized protein n=1 Tax=Aphanomyces astaci TaxID=112090 RepID=A0A3R6ZWA0_APHAT|nr:hypothetical protein DYB35_013259 [Aphanomyces astaci]